MDNAKPLQHEQRARPAPERSMAGPGAARAGARRSLEAKPKRKHASLTDGQGFEYSRIGTSWILFAPAMAMAYAVAALLIGSVPPWWSLAMIVAAVGIVGLNGFWLRLEARFDPSPAAALAVLLVAVTLPSLFFGLSLEMWAARAAHGGWDSVIGTLVVLSSLSAVLLNGRVIADVNNKAAMWIGVTAIYGSTAAWLTFFVCCVMAAGICFRELRFSRQGAMMRQAQQRQQARAEEILAEYEQTGQGWFWETERRGNLIYVSRTVAAAMQREQEELLGMHLTELFILGSNEGERSLTFHLSARSSFREIAVRACCPGEERWWSISGRPIYDEFNNFVGFRGSGSDLTERRRSEQNATRLAHYDSLTGLTNRFQMQQTLEKILASPRLEQRACAVFLLDLDRFKQVNDTMGHPAGDALLKQVAERLQHTVGELGRVGRLGGDEFKVILPGIHERETLATLARRIITNLSLPYQIESSRVIIGASVGIALSPDDGSTADALIRNADLALYAAKDGGRGRHHFYAADLHSDAEERRQLEQDLRDALAQGGLELHYQPVIHTVTERITGFEALLRWTHPTRGRMSPAKFIPVAEDAGLIAPIGEWALRKACEDLATLPKSVRVAVNVSPLQFANPNLPAIVTNALAASQIEPSRLELEITESVFLNDDAGTDAMFAALKRIGVRMALDDFGTGYSSLGYLKKAPFDKIKIDQSFVRGATEQGSRNGAIISSIVSLAEALGMETTAEGVETLDELDLVRMLGCSHIQGYIYDKPLTLEDARLRLSAGTTALAQGPRSARASRKTMLRKIVLEHGGQQYAATVRNVSTTGAMVEGLWNVPPGTIFNIHLGTGNSFTATSRWCCEDRMGMEFAYALDLDAGGAIAAFAGRSDATLSQTEFRQAG